MHYFQEHFMTTRIMSYESSVHIKKYTLNIFQRVSIKVTIEINSIFSKFFDSANQSHFGMYKEEIYPITAIHFTSVIFIF